MKTYKEYTEGKILGNTLKIVNAPDPKHKNTGPTTILKWGGKSVDIFNLPSGAGKLEKLIPKPIAKAKDKDWEPFIVMAIGLNLL
jgi:hypothetical protein